MKNEPVHILLADDDEADRMLFVEAFSEIKINTEVNTVNDGIELMEYLESDKKRIPNFIFLDLNMPLKNGIDCLKEIKSNEKFNDIIIAIYSTSDDKKDIEETFTNGANVYITKPNSFNKLKEVLQKAVTSAFQYQDNSMKRENFLLRI